MDQNPPLGLNIYTIVMTRLLDNVNDVLIGTKALNATVLFPETKFLKKPFIESQQFDFDENDLQLITDMPVCVAEVKVCVTNPS
ncbi:hypothetical protein [Chengkuizengella axinellae]|uniref:Uncharacterized protein n=1 Tax=Chengkuizengella axinellae TaxID=3064388 RepID=A0ABT9IVW6_9BACL|nr:hypothetical protein [Chengkuizengella sp. 2205SS18-9]MDP5272954.1 hypothetical protein [Chengkuizengella sp. 2205SS18-9]